MVREVEGAGVGGVVDEGGRPPVVQQLQRAQHDREAKSTFGFGETSSAL